MDVLCVGMYRACSTWQYEVVAHLVERHLGGRRLGYLTGDEYAELESYPADHCGWRVLKSHEEHPAFTAALAEGRALTIYAFRDLRDVVYSMLHKRGVAFDEFLQQGMVHQILANDRYWSRQPRRITQRYEDLIAEPVLGVEQLAEHLGIRLEAGESEQVASDYSLEANRRRTERMAARLKAQGLDLNDPANFQRWDQKTLLHWNHVRSGRAGDWYERTNPRERRLLARIGGRWLDRHGYERDNPPAAPGFAAWIGEETALARGWMTCRLRCAALRHPQTARVVKRFLGISTLPTRARPATAFPPHWPTTIPAPHRRVRSQTLDSAPTK